MKTVDVDNRELSSISTWYGNLYISDNINILHTALSRTVMLKTVMRFLSVETGATRQRTCSLWLATLLALEISGDFHI